MNLDEKAKQVWTEHVTTTPEQVEYNREQWKKAVQYLGPRWIALSMNRKDSTCE